MIAVDPAQQATLAAYWLRESERSAHAFCEETATQALTTVGKTSFPEEQLLENYAAVIEEIIRAKPSAAKGRYLRTITVANTMGPGIRVDPSRTRDIVEETAAVA